MSGKPQRLIALLAVLQVRRVTTAEALAAEFGVSARTILRDIQALIDADIPVLTERGKYGGISLLPGSQADLSKLTASEADVLRAVGLDLGRAARLGAETAARSAAGKLTAKRRAPLRGDPPLALSDVLTVDNRGWFAADESPDVASLARDLRLARRLRIRYRHSGAAESQVYVVDPYGLLLRADRWYLIADASPARECTRSPAWSTGNYSPRHAVSAPARPSREPPPSSAAPSIPARDHRHRAARRRPRRYRPADPRQPAALGGPRPGRPRQHHRFRYHRLRQRGRARDRHDRLRAPQRGTAATAVQRPHRGHQPTGSAAVDLQASGAVGSKHR